MIVPCYAFTPKYCMRNYPQTHASKVFIPVFLVVLHFSLFSTSHFILLITWCPRTVTGGSW